VYSPWHLFWVVPACIPLPVFCYFRVHSRSLKKHPPQAEHCAPLQWPHGSPV
jgi:hypothetical protein